jgi:hypothetical protein
MLGLGSNDIIIDSLKASMHVKIANYKKFRSSF